MDVERIWQWYWQSQARTEDPGAPVLDQLVRLWNWVMGNEVARVALPAVLVVWLVAVVADSVLGGGRRVPAESVEPGEWERYRDLAGEPASPPLTGAELKRELDRLGKTQTELAAELGVTRAYVSHLIRGRKPVTPALHHKCRAVLEAWQASKGS